MRRTLLLAALLSTAAFSSPAAHASACVDTGKLRDRVGWCTYSNGCASAYADATPQIMDDTYVVWGCAGEDGVFLCYGHARTYVCTDDRP